MTGSTWFDVEVDCATTASFGVGAGAAGATGAAGAISGFGAAETEESG
jgi:hypothetical protein